MNSIFVKQTEIKKNNNGNNNNNNDNVLSKNEIIKSIPKPFFQKEDSILSQINIEWRWRFFKIPNKKNEVVEISYKHPNKKRKYINSSGEWVERDIGKEFDQYIVEEFYHYNNDNNDNKK